MDPALLRDRELFRKRALAQPVVESKSNKRSLSSNDDKKGKKHKGESPSSAPLPANLMEREPPKTMVSGPNLMVMSKIIKTMKSRYQEGDSEPLSLENILEETNQNDCTNKTKIWLANDGLPSNPKVFVTEDGKFAFKPTYKLKDKKTLMKLLDRNDREGKGTVWMEDIVESLPNAEKIIKSCGDSILILNRLDKKKIMCYNDKSCSLKVSEEFTKLWRSVTVDGTDEQKIAEYLNNQGIASMDVGGKAIPIQKRKKVSNRKRTFKKTNDHVADILQDYDK